MVFIYPGTKLTWYAFETQVTFDIGRRMYIKKLFNIPSSEPHGQGQIWKNGPTFQIQIFLYFPTYRRKTKCMALMSMKPTAKIVKFIAPGLGGLWNREGPYTENLSNSRNSSSLSLHIVKKKIHDYDMLNLRKSSYQPFTFIHANIAHLHICLWSFPSNL